MTHLRTLAGRMFVLDHTPVEWSFYMQRGSGRALAAGLLLAMTAALFAPKTLAQSKGGSAMPKVGDMAPDFTLKYATGDDLKEVKLSDYRGKKNVVVAFYVFAFTGG